MSEEKQNEKSLRENGTVEKNESSLHVPHVYVPSFTEASENYRMASKETPKVEREVKVIEKTAAEAVPFDAASEDFENGNRDYDDRIIHVKVEVESDAAPSLFQAKKPLSDDTATPENAPLDEAADIHKLINPNQKESDEEQPSSAEEKEKSEEKVDLSSYVLPDPEMPKEAEKPASLEFVPMAHPVKKVSRTFEYVTTDDSNRYKNRFLDKILSLRVRLFTALLLTVLFAVGTLLSACGKDLAAILGFGDYAHWLPLVDLQGAVCLLLLALPETVLRVREAIAKKFVFSMCYPVLFLLTVVFDVFAIVKAETEYPLFAAFFGLATLVMILCRYWNLKSAFASFLIVSSGEEKTVVERVNTADFDKETLALDGAIDEYRSAMAKFHKTDFVSDFQKHLHTPEGHDARTVLALFVALGLTLVGSIVAAILGGDGALSMFYCATLAFYFLPLAAFAVFEWPFRLASMQTEKDKGAILGTAAALSYADVDVLTFADTEVFEKDDIKIQHVRLFGDATYNDVFRDMTALFATVGGTLYQLFSEALDRTVSQAAEPLAEKNGISGKIDGVKVLAGTAAYLRKNGVSLPDEEENVALTNRVMYAVKNGVVTAQFLISYSMSEGFSMLMPHLRKAHVIPLIYTRDPNLDNELFTALMREEGAVRVIKETLPEEKEAVLPSFSAGMVTLGGKSVAISMLLLAKKLSKFFRTAANVFGYAFIATPLLSVGLTLGHVKAPVVTLILAVWQVLSCGVFAFFSTRKFGPKN